MCLFKAAGKRAGLWRSGGCRNRAGEQDQGPPNQMAEAARRMEGGKGGQGTESRPGCLKGLCMLTVLRPSSASDPAKSLGLVDFGPRAGL